MKPMAKLTTFLFLTLVSVASNASLILGTGSGALIGGDLTDPENDGAPQAYINYNANFSASNEQYYTGEGAFNVFDNLVGSGQAKWCCQGPSANSPVWVQADFGSVQYLLTSFTIASGNDVSSRDPLNWSILGSNDGSTFTTIFNRNDTSAVWTQRNQVIQFSAGPDFSLQNEGFSIFRFEAYLTGGNNFQINELEFFGNEVPVSEPSIIGLMSLCLITLGLRRRKLR